MLSLRHLVLCLSTLSITAVSGIMPPPSLAAGEMHEQPASSQQRMKGLMERIFTNSSSSRTRYDPRPNAFLVESVRDLKPGTALDVGMGQGRNALHLARLGWQVTGFDLSPSGVQLAREQARAEGLRLEAAVASDREFDFGTNRWDLIVLCYVEFRQMLDRIRTGLKPGGFVVVEYYHRDTRKHRPILEDKSFSDNELPRLFDDFRILRYEDAAARPDWNFTGSERHRVVRLLAQKKDPREAPVCFRGDQTFGEGKETCWEDKRMRCTATGWERRGTCK